MLFLNKLCINTEKKKIVTMTDSMKFGPEWLRNLSSEGNNSLNSSGGTRYQLAEHRYGREEMLALFEQSLKLRPPSSMMNFPTLYVDQAMNPLALAPMTEDENRLWTHGSSAVVGGGGGGVRGRGGSMDRGGGRGRGRGGSYHPSFNRSSSTYDEPVRSYNRSQSDRTSWQERNGDSTDWGGSSPRKEYSIDRGSRSSNSSENWRRHPHPHPRHSDHLLDSSEGGVGSSAPSGGDTWRGAGSNKWQRSHSGNWREGGDSEIGERQSNRPHWSSSNEHVSRGPQQRRPWDAEDHLPEWATENPTEVGGTFDSSGKFHNSDDESDCSIKGGGGTSKKDTPLQKSQSQNTIGSYGSKGVGSPKRQPLTQSQSAINLNKKPPENEEIGSKSKEKTEKVSEKSEKITLSDSQSSFNEPVKKESQNSVKSEALKDQKIDKKSEKIEEKIIETKKEEVQSNRVDDEFEHMKEVTIDIVSKLITDDDPFKVTASETLASPVSAPNYVQNQVPSGLGTSTSAIPSSTNIPGMDKWLYRDPQGEVQGPFSCTEMTEWYRAGYFSINLMVRRQCDEKYWTLGELVKNCGGLPFINCRLPPSKLEKSHQNIPETASQDPIIQQQIQMQRFLRQTELLRMTLNPNQIESNIIDNQNHNIGLQNPNLGLQNQNMGLQNNQNSNLGLQNSQNQNMGSLGLQNQTLGLQNQNMGLQNQNMGLQNQNLGLQNQNLGSQGLQGLQNANIGLQNANLGLQSSHSQNSLHNNQNSNLGSQGLQNSQNTNFSAPNVLDLEKNFVSQQNPIFSNSQTQNFGSQNFGGGPNSQNFASPLQNNQNFVTNQNFVSSQNPLLNMISQISQNSQNSTSKMKTEKLDGLQALVQQMGLLGPPNLGPLPLPGQVVPPNLNIGSNIPVNANLGVNPILAPQMNPIMGSLPPNLPFNTQTNQVPQGNNLENQTDEAIKNFFRQLAGKTQGLDSMWASQSQPNFVGAQVPTSQWVAPGQVPQKLPTSLWEMGTAPNVPQPIPTPTSVQEKENQNSVEEKEKQRKEQEEKTRKEKSEKENRKKKELEKQREEKVKKELLEIERSRKEQIEVQERSRKEQEQQKKQKEAQIEAQKEFEKQQRTQEKSKKPSEDKKSESKTDSKKSTKKPDGKTESKKIDNETQKRSDTSEGLKKAQIEAQEAQRRSDALKDSQKKSQNDAQKKLSDSIESAQKRSEGIQIKKSESGQKLDSQKDALKKLQESQIEVQKRQETLKKLSESQKEAQKQQEALKKLQESQEQAQKRQEALKKLQESQVEAQKRQEALKKLQERQVEEQKRQEAIKKFQDTQELQKRQEALKKLQENQKQAQSQQADALKKMQENQNQKNQQSTKVPWGNVNQSMGQTQMSQTGKTLSLAEIQRIEREKKIQEQALLQQQQRILQQQKEMQEQQAAIERQNSLQLGWAKKVITPKKVKSLAEIQAEEQEKLQKQLQEQRQAQLKQERESVHANTNVGIWGAASQSLHWNNNGQSGGFWDETPSVQVQKTQQQVVTKIVSQTVTVAKQPTPSAVAAPKTKVKKEEDHVKKIFDKSTMYQDEFINWCTKTLQTLNTEVDIPTFVGFLKDIESPYEVKDYVRQYLGENSQAAQFANQFVERRSRAKDKQRAANQHKDDLNTPAPANPNNSEFTEVKVGKGKKSKKKNMVKLDNTALGFNVIAAQDRINVGDRDYGDV